VQVTRYTNTTLGAFFHHALPFLVTHEAENNLILGTSETIRQHQDIYPNAYFSVVEDSDGIALVVMMTPPYGPVLSYCESFEAVVESARDLFDLHTSLPGINGPKSYSKRFAEAWNELTGTPFRLSMSERIFKLTQVTPSRTPSGRFRAATVLDRPILIDWYNAFDVEALGTFDHTGNDRRVDDGMDFKTRGLFLWEDQIPVSMAGFSGPTPHGMRIGPVYTPQEFRGKGYASALVAALSQMLLDGGRQFVFLYTDLANLTSNHIYQTMGYEPVCDVDLFKFGA
jgi:uncharacterized protein